MDFNDTPQEAEYRAKVRAWIAEAAKEYEGLPEPKSQDEFVARQKSWQKKKYEAGYAGLTWPKAFGGQGLGPMNAIIFGQEEAKSAAPTGLYSIGLGMCIPTVFTHGPKEAIERFVRALATGPEPDEITLVEGPDGQREMEPVLAREQRRARAFAP